MTAKVVYHGNLFGDYIFVFNDCECVGFIGSDPPFYNESAEEFIKDLEDGNYGGFIHDPIEKCLTEVEFR
jgi:hypothetical protein